jgi:ELWxxDGT repeat protein
MFASLTGASVPLAATDPEPAPALAACLVRDAVKGAAPLAPPSVVLGHTKKGTIFAAAKASPIDRVVTLWVSDPVVGARPLAALCAGCWAQPRATLGDAVIFDAQGTWRTDGTAAGTWRIPDHPRTWAFDSDPAMGAIVAGQRLVSAECSDVNASCKLWYVDPAAKTWKLLASLLSPSTSAPTPLLSVLAGDVYLLALDTLWRVPSKGGPPRVVWRGEAQWNARSLTALAGRLVWFGSTADGGFGVWTYNPTDGRLRLLGDPLPWDGPVQSDFVAVDNRAYVWLDDDSLGEEIWSTDGQTALRRETDFADAGPPSADFEMVRASAGVVFRARTNSRTSFFALTSPGNAPRLLHTPCDNCEPPPSSGGTGSSLVQAGSRAVFVGGTVDTGYEPWTTDGTVEGTKMLVDHCPGACSSAIKLRRELPVALFDAASAGGGERSALWRSDGTAAGTFAIGPLPKNWTTFLGYQSLNDGPHWNLATQRFVYPALQPQPGIYAANPNTEGAATLLVGTRDAPLGVEPTHLTAFGGGLVFEQSSTSSQRTWWSVTGTPAKLRKLAIGRTCFSTCPSPFASAGPRFVFLHQGQLWSGDGRPNGFEQLTHDPLGFSSTTDLSSSGGLVWFRVGEELWVSDGTAGGTRHFSLPDAELAASSPRVVTQVGDRLYLAARTSSGDLQVWRTDGTSSGTELLEGPLRYGVYCSVSQVNGKLVFGIFEFDRERFEVWSHDPGTGSWLSLGRLDEESCQGDSVVYGGGAFHLRTRLSSDNENLLWKLWRVAPGNSPVEISSGTAVPTPWYLPEPSLFSDASGVWWGLDSEALGSELWRSDGTTRGTGVFRDLFPGAYGSSPRGLTSTPLGLFFSALSPTTGREAWRIEPSSTPGPVTIDASPGAASGDAAGFTTVGNRVYFAATRPDVGRELFYWSPTGCQK